MEGGVSLKQRELVFRNPVKNWRHDIDDKMCWMVWNKYCGDTCQFPETTTNSRYWSGGFETWQAHFPLMKPIPCLLVSSTSILMYNRCFHSWTCRCLNKQTTKPVFSLRLVTPKPKLIVCNNTVLVDIRASKCKGVCATKKFLPENVHTCIYSGRALHRLITWNHYITQSSRQNIRQDGS